MVPKRRPDVNRSPASGRSFRAAAAHLSALDGGDANLNAGGARAGGSEHESPAPEPTKKKILLVDDSLTALMMSQMVLKKTPHAVVTARNGKEAIDKALAERPDLIVMDVVMPELNGFQACRRLRTIEQTRSTPIILLTSRSEKESVTNGFATGCTEYMLKPVSGPDLLARVKSYLGK